MSVAGSTSEEKIEMWRGGKGSTAKGARTVNTNNVPSRDGRRGNQDLQKRRGNVHLPLGKNVAMCWSLTK